jgi:hypothetical protein
MKHRAFGLFVCVLFGAGCVTGLDTRPESAKPAAAVAPVIRPPVRPEQVTAQNAHKQSQALWDELDREAQEGLAGGR